MKAPLESAITGITSLISEFVTDPDKQTEAVLKAKELEFSLRESLLKTTTTPKVDAFVKILMAFRDIIIPMFRPVGSIAMAVFGAYCIKNGIQINETISTMLFGAPVAWGLSRHIDKKEAKKVKITEGDFE